MTGNRGLQGVIRVMERIHSLLEKEYLLPADTEMPAPAITTTFWLFVNTFNNRSNSGCCSGSMSLRRKSRYSVLRSFDILLRFVGGGPSLSDIVLESVPSGAGEPLCEVDCEEGGDGRCMRKCERGGGMSGGGEGELAGELNGEDMTLDGGEERGLDERDCSDSVSTAMMCAWRGAAEGAGGQCVSKECYHRDRIVEAELSRNNTREFRVRRGRGVCRAAEVCAVAGRR